jgi:UDPglucose--hexose-1-phosphate uridylyltransferase
MTEISMSHLREIVKAFVHRLRFWRDDGQCRYGLIFKNHGPRAGASLTHVHSQLIAFVNHVPEPIATEVSRVGSYYLRNSECAYCRYIQQERADHNRVVFDDDGFIAFCPFASWQPHETWLMPTEHASSFELAREDVLDRLVVALHRLFALLETIAPNAQYNMILRTAPWDDDYEIDYHWRIELLPRVNPIAGLEMATGTHINPLAPELAASELRAAQVF